MANRISLNPTSYHGAGAVKEIVTEASKVGIGDLFKNKEYALPFIAFNVKFAFILLALFCVVGFASAILVFRKRRYNTFEEEEVATEVAETTEAK